MVKYGWCSSLQGIITRLLLSLFVVEDEKKKKVKNTEKKKNSTATGSLRQLFLSSHLDGGGEVSTEATCVHEADTSS